jgi:hydroxymethylbilane synthase
MTCIRIGTRASNLALWQAHHIRDCLQALAPGTSIEIVTISTKGDRILDRPLAAIGGKGLFVKEIEQALLDGAIDLAVHSLKDMPTEQPPGLELVAFPERADPFDTLCAREPGHTLESLPHGARVGTGSLRRQAQLRRLRPDLEIVAIRGNVETRLSKRHSGDIPLDAVVLASAGLIRLGIHEDGFSALTAPEYLPAPGQGCLAIETRSDDAETRALVDRLDHADTRIAIVAERAALRAIEGDCHTPFAAYARRDGVDGLLLQARLLDEDGTETAGRRMVVLRDGEDPLMQAEALGATLGRNLLERHLAARS